MHPSDHPTDAPRDLHREPITDEPGAHPIGTAIGASGGAITGASFGIVGGPVGVAVGAVVGAVIGGLAGKGAAEAVNPTAEENHWREVHDRQDYAETGRTFDDYGPAYRHGVLARQRYEIGTSFDAVDAELAAEWEAARGPSGLPWTAARPATRAAWERIDRVYLDGDTHDATRNSDRGGAREIAG